MHVTTIVVRRQQPGIKQFDEFGITRPIEFVRREIVVDRLARRQQGDGLVLDEFGIGIQILVGRQFLPAGRFEPRLRMAADFNDQLHQLKIEIVGLVDRCEQCFLGGDHIGRIRFQVSEKGFDDLDSE